MPESAEQHLTDVPDVKTPEGAIRREDIISFDALFVSMMKCRRGVLWKPSVASFYLNALERVAKLARDLETGTYAPRPPRHIKITYPKRRDGLCISFRDRVYQRSLNDLALYPMVTRTFIYDNAACQKLKGSSFARERLKKFLRNHYHHYGNAGYAAHIDVSGYYPNMRHDVARETFRKRLPPDIYEMAAKALDGQYAGDVGFSPGSQMVQIAGVAVLDDLDHFIKEKLRVRHYLRYMDDFILIGNDYAALADQVQAIVAELGKLGFSASPKKTKIVPLREGFKCLGFTFRLTDTGKVLLFIDPQNVKHERLKLRRLVRLSRAGVMPREHVGRCFQSWLAHAAQGNSFKLIERMKTYYANLWRTPK